MPVSNPDRSPFRINGSHTAPTPTAFLGLVGDYLQILHIIGTERCVGFMRTVTPPQATSSFALGFAEVLSKTSIRLFRSIRHLRLGGCQLGSGAHLSKNSSHHTRTS